MAAQARRRVYPKLDPFETLNDRMFIKIFLDAPIRRSAISKQTKILIALNFFASGSYQNSVAYNLFWAVSQSTVSRCITEVVNALNQPAIFNTWVKFPNTLRQLETIREEFYHKYGMPGVIGVIDCTHVAIYPPQIHNNLYPEHIYVYRKNYHSINVQLICDSNLKITNVNARFPGSTHDAKHMEPFPSGRSSTYYKTKRPKFFFAGRFRISFEIVASNTYPRSSSEYTPICLQRSL
ncbi:unnamed protein product [Tenebrio molitor]|nr:unnamed protein product [Tenebrio molitor]